MTTKTTTNITDLWTRSDKTIAKDRLDLAFRQLRSNADGYLVKCEGDVLNAQEASEKASMSARTAANFQAIVDARINLRAAELTLAEARIVYAATFGE